MTTMQKIAEIEAEVGDLGSSLPQIAFYVMVSHRNGFTLIFLLADGQDTEE